MWPAGSSYIITELVGFPTGLKVVNFFLAGGNLAELQPHVPIIEAWAKEQGCTRATCTGRHGWARMDMVKEGS